MYKDSFGIQHKEFKDYLNSPSAVGKEYDDARADKKLIFTREDYQKVFDCDKCENI